MEEEEEEVGHKCYTEGTLECSDSPRPLREVVSGPGCAERRGLVSVHWELEAAVEGSSCGRSGSIGPDCCGHWGEVCVYACMYKYRPHCLVGFYMFHYLVQHTHLIRNRQTDSTSSDPLGE